ncbi:hypothetical protein IWX47DRAFT_255659 [Phyllosticta citricarpa]
MNLNHAISIPFIPIPIPTPIPMPDSPLPWGGGTSLGPGRTTGWAPPEAEAEPDAEVMIGGMETRLAWEDGPPPPPPMWRGPIGALAGPLGPVALAVLVVLMLLPAGDGRLLTVSMLERPMMGGPVGIKGARGGPRSSSDRNSSSSSMAGPGPGPDRDEVDAVKACPWPPAGEARDMPCCCALTLGDVTERACICWRAEGSGKLGVEVLLAWTMGDEKAVGVMTEWSAERVGVIFMSAKPVWNELTLALRVRDLWRMGAVCWS